MTNAIIIDGVGINLKTSIINQFKDDGYATLESNSWFYSEDRREQFPFQMKYSTRIQSRYLEMMAAIQANQTDAPIIVDRGIINQAIWGQLTYHEIVDDFLHDDQDMRVIETNMDYYKSLEDSIKVKRVLLSTDWDALLDFVFDETEMDPHKEYRIDTFYNPEHYKEVRDTYEGIYNSYMVNEDVLRILIKGNDLKDIPMMISEIEQKIIDFINKVD